MSRDSYNIKVQGEDGQPEAKRIFGTIVGPFGVSEECDGDGFFVVTHRHSGLKIRQLASIFRGNCIRGANAVWYAIPWWASHKPERIAKENGLTLQELKAKVESIALFNGCEGQESNGL